MSDNLTAFLTMIRACEGTDTDDGYRALFGYTPTNGKVFDNGYVRHPDIKSPFTQTDGHLNYSSAAGAYQFIYSTWNELQQKLNLPDFSPESQDAAATELIRECGALSDIEAGYLSAAIDKCAGIWASLPASHYPQPKRTFQFALDAYTEAGGQYVA